MFFKNVGGQAVYTLNYKYLKWELFQNSTESDYCGHENITSL
jgi:hypothetical protein